MNKHMDTAGAAVSESSATDVTHVWFGSRVQSYMMPQLLRLNKCLITQRTLEHFLPRVSPNVSAQLVRLRECLAAEIANKRSFTAVNSNVTNKWTFPIVLFIAVWAFEQFHSSMILAVRYQVLFVVKTFLALLAFERSLMKVLVPSEHVLCWEMHFTERASETLLCVMWGNVWRQRSQAYIGLATRHAMIRPVSSVQSTVLYEVAFSGKLLVAQCTHVRRSLLGFLSFLSFFLFCDHRVIICFFCCIHITSHFR